MEDSEKSPLNRLPNEVKKAVKDLSKYVAV